MFWSRIICFCSRPSCHGRSGFFVFIRSAIHRFVVELVGHLFLSMVFCCQMFDCTWELRGIYSPWLAFWQETDLCWEPLGAFLCSECLDGVRVCMDKDSRHSCPHAFSRLHSGSAYVMTKLRECNWRSPCNICSCALIRSCSYVLLSGIPL